MSKINELPKGKIKKNGQFYGWAFIGVMFILMGVFAIVNRHFQYRSNTPPLEGNLAVSVGLIFVFYGIFSIYHLLFKAEKKELAHEDFHVLEDFKDCINNHQTIFKIIKDATFYGNNSTVPIVYYTLQIKFEKNLFINVNIRQRDRVEYLLWKIGITRKWDYLTGNYYFDSKYHVQCTNKKLFNIIFNKKIINLLEDFDRDYPPIRDKNGILTITDSFIQYTEGPYNEQQRLFDPHRGKIELIFNELIKIVQKIEDNVPRNLSNQHKNQIIVFRNNILKKNIEKKETRDFFLNLYRFILYAICIFLFMIVFLYK